MLQSFCWLFLQNSTFWGSLKLITVFTSKDGFARLISLVPKWKTCLGNLQLEIPSLHTDELIHSWFESQINIQNSFSKICCSFIMHVTIQVIYNIGYWTFSSWFSPMLNIIWSWKFITCTELFEWKAAYGP